MIETILGLVTYYISFLYEYFDICNLSGEKIKVNIKSIFITLTVAAMNYILTMLGIINLKMIISFFSIYMICRLLVQQDSKKAFITSVIFYLIIVFIEHIFSIILIDVLKYNPGKYIVSVGIQKSIIGNIVNVILFFTCILPVFKKIIFKISDILERSGVKSSHLYLFILTVFMIQISYITNISGKAKLAFTIIYVTIFLLFIIYFVISIYRNYCLKQLNEFLISRDNEMQKVLDDNRIFRHNIKHDLLSISSVSNNKTKKMIECIVKDYQIDYEILNNMSKMPSGIQGVIYQKMINSQKHSCKILADNYVENDPVLKLSVKDYYKFIECVGILIDNAIENSDGEKDDFVYIYLGENDKNYELKVINKIRTHITVDNLFNKGVTSKKDHMGLGLYYIEKKTKFDVKIKVDSSLFTVNLLIKKGF